MTTFISIYNWAMSKFDDPILSQIYRENSHEFFRIMYLKMQSAISEFVIPKYVSAKLEDRIEPVFYKEVFDGDGVADIFTLTAIELTGEVMVEARVNGVVIDITSIIDKTITLSSVPPQGNGNVEISVYIDGFFNQNLTFRTQDILALLIVKAWAEKERNFLLDIRRLIGDKDFRLISEANSLREKNNWYNSIREEADKKMTALSWSTSMENRRRR